MLRLYNEEQMSESINCTRLKTTDPTFRQRKRPTSLNQKPSKNNSGKEEKLVAGPKGVPAPRQTGRLTVGHNIT
jgi:hypothetical protein